MTTHTNTAPERGALLGFIAVPKAFAYTMPFGTKREPMTVLVHAQTAPLEATGVEEDYGDYAQVTLSASRIGSERNPFAPRSTPTTIALEMSHAQLVEMHAGLSLPYVYRDLLTPERIVARPWMLTTIESIKFLAITQQEARMLRLLRQAHQGLITEAEGLAEIREILGAY